MRKIIAFAGLAMVMSLGAGTRLGAAENPPLPRYKFQAGQELVYEGSSRFQYNATTQGTTDKTTFRVTRRNPDGSWHIVADGESTMTFNSGPAQGGSASQDKRTTCDAFDVFPDGRVTNAPADVMARGLTQLFYQLPASDTMARAGWEAPAANEEEKAGYRLAAQNDPAAGKWILEKTDHGLFNVIYLSTNKAIIHFDAGRGLVTKVESENSQGYGINGKGTGAVKLKSTTNRERAWMDQFAREADIYLQAKAAWRKAQTAAQGGAKASDALAAAEKALRDGRQQLKLPELTSQFDTQLAEISKSASYFAEEAKEGEAVLNQPAADWATTDIDGKKCALADYRGKVVMLDFWYRGCGWCIRAMPQLKEVAEHYRGKPVAILGMNTDRDEKDARFVIDKLKLNYPTLHAEGLPEKYKVRGFPTFVIIDQQGVVRARHVGYSPDLRDDVIKTIDGLLAGGR